MTEETIVNQLTQYGLNVEEVKIYVELAKIGPSKASTLATRLGYDRAKTYRTLDRLREKGIVESSLSKPMRFIALPLEKVVDILIQGLKNKVRMMEDGREGLLAEWSRLPTVTTPIEGPRFKIHQGRLRIYAELVRMIKSAKREVLFLTTRNDLMRMVHAEVYDALVEASRAGIGVKVLTEIDKVALDVAKEYSMIAKIRHIEMPGLARFFTIDDSEILISATPDDSMKLDESRDIGLWTDATDFVRVIRVFFQETWDGALDAEARIRAIVTGAPVEELRVVRSVDEYGIMLSRMVASAKTDVTFIVNIPNPLLLPDSLWQILPGLAIRGVKVRILTTVSSDNLEMIKRLRSFAEVKHLRSRLGLQILMMDRREVLLSSSEPGETLGVNVWSDIKAHVYLIVQLADELWREGLEADPLIQKLEVLMDFKKALTHLQEELNKLGWGLESPGVIEGLSGASHPFDILIKNLKQPSQIIVADFKPEREAVGPLAMLSLYTKIIDAKPSRAFILTLSDLTLEGKRLAKTYGIEVITENSVEEVLKRFLHSILPTGSEV